MRSALFSIGLLCVLSCQPDTLEEYREPLVNYASTFKISTINGGYILDINGDTYELLRKPTALDENAIKIPINSCIGTSTTQLGFITLLSQQEKLIGFPNPSLIYDTAYRDVENVGSEMALNAEMIMSLNPDVVIADYLTDGSLSAFESSGIALLKAKDYLEQHPLGRAEYIKMYGALFDCMDVADSIFTHIDSLYNNLKKDTIDPNQQVISGMLYSGSWYAPGGKSYMARLFQDAGMNYIFSDNNDKGSTTLNIETVIQETDSGTIWLGSLPTTDKKNLLAIDPRLKLLPFIDHRVLHTYGATRGYANDYFEMGTARPDRILKDLINISGQNTPDSLLFYFRKLN